MKQFKQKMAELSKLYDTCLDRYEVSYALYPDNSVIQEMKTEYAYFFKLFHETTPLSKKLFTLVDNGKDMGRRSPLEDSAFVPSFSLGVSQVTPKKLVNDMEGIQVAREGDQLNVSGNVGFIRPRRETKVSQICRSPFVSRVVDISTHSVNGEESRVWDWLFSNKRNKK